MLFVDKYWILLSFSKRSGGYLALANLHGVMITKLPDDVPVSASASWGIMEYPSEAWHGENVLLALILAFLANHFSARHMSRSLQLMS